MFIRCNSCRWNYRNYDEIILSGNRYSAVKWNCIKILSITLYVMSLASIINITCWVFNLKLYSIFSNWCWIGDTFSRWAFLSGKGYLKVCVSRYGLVCAYLICDIGLTWRSCSFSEITTILLASCNIEHCTYTIIRLRSTKTSSITCDRILMKNYINISSTCVRI